MAFLTAVAKFKFSCLATVVDKRVFLPVSAIKETFYQEIVTAAFARLEPYIHAAYVQIHRSGGKDFGRRLCKHIGARAPSNDERRIVKQVKLAKAEGNNLIQLADMVVGSIVRSYRDDRDDRDVYRNLIRKRIIEVIEYPG
jgi:hypothetical protein